MIFQLPRILFVLAGLVTCLSLPLEFGLADDQPRSGRGAPQRASDDPVLPAPTLAEVRYGDHERHVLDFWKAESTSPTPVVFVIHGGGWTSGTKERAGRFVDVQKLLDSGISVVAINYRLISHATEEGIKPPVKAPLHDAARALQFVRSKAGEWNLDKNRIGAAGGSAGACSSLWLAFHDDLADPSSSDSVARESTRLQCAAVTGAQTTLDPQQMKAWTPNSRYGAHAFGITTPRGVNAFDKFLSEREQILSWIKEYSPYSLVSKDDPPVYLIYSAEPALGQDQKDPTHTANFGVMLQKHCQEIGVTCDLVYPHAPNVNFASPTDYLIHTLTGQGNASAPPSVQKGARAQWDLTTLYQAPAMKWISQEGPVHSLLYSGEPFAGQETEVFAFYASPATLGEAQPGTTFPGIVLIHGGGGTAFAEWTWLWAKRGYAAIAMDLSGSRPIAPVYDSQGVPVPNQAARQETRTRLPNGGPDHGHEQKFDSIGGDVSDDWPYHAVASVIRAHSLLRSFPEVQSERTAVTGISWGGYTTCLVASVDSRFKAAVPVYGCGFLYEGESVQKPAIDKLGDRRQDWIQAYDPSSHLVKCRVPILFVNGTNDVHYPLDSYQKSFDLVPGPKQLRIEVNMRHGHPPGWAPQEIGLFVDSHCRDGLPLPNLGKPALEGEHVQVTFNSQVPLKSAQLHYSTDSGLRSSRTWTSLPAEIRDNIIQAPKPPAQANTWFLSVVDERDAMVSTTIQFQN